MSNRQGYAELFELPMVLSTCGYNLPTSRVEELQEFLVERNATKIDLNSILETLKYLKQLEL